MDVGTLRERVGVWIRAGLITPEQADSILALEAPRPTSGMRRDVPEHERRARLAEVVGYVGAAFALGAVGLLGAQLWPDLAVWARTTLTALLTLIALGAGVLLHGRRGDAVRRLTSVLWTAGVGGTAWTTGIVAWDVLDVPERWMPTIVAGVAALVAGVLLLVGRHLLVQLALFATLGTAVAGALLALAPLEPGPLALGLLITGGGAAWGLAGAGGWLGPRRSAEVTGAVFTLIGAQVLSATAWPVAARSLGIVLALALVALSIPTERTHLLYIGALGLFVAVPALVIELFADTLGAPTILLVIGLLLVLIAVGIGRVRRTKEQHDG